MLNSIFNLSIIPETNQFFVTKCMGMSEGYANKHIYQVPTQHFEIYYLLKKYSIIIKKFHP